MANKKINQLVSKTSILSTDLFGIGDATTGQLFKKTIAELQAAIGGAVISVNGLVGTVVLDTDDIQELATPTNKYFTDARARSAISLTVTGNSGASTYSSGTGVLNVPTYTLAGLGGITASFLSGTSGISYNSTTGVISYSGTVYTDASIRALISASTGLTYNSSTGVFTNTITQYTDALARVSISAGTGISYSSATGIITNTITQYTDALARASISAGTGISYSSGTGIIASTITQYTDALARASISLTTTGSSGASTYNSTTGVFNVPNYTLTGLGGITATFLSGGAGITYNSTTGAISYSGTVYTDASIRALLSGSTGITYNSSTGAISYSGTVYTDSSVRALISLTTTGTSGASTYNNTTGVINVPNYTLAGLGGISLISLSGGTGITYNSSTGAISYSGTVYTDASVRALISATAPISYNNTTGVISITQSSTSANGFLSSTDWNTFNNKQSTITLTTTGTSGAATFSSGTLNIPQYSTDLSGYVTLSTTQTISGAKSFTNNLTIRPSTGYNAYFQTSGTALRINYLNDALSANISASYRATDYSFQDGSGVSILTLASTGAATFSSSVTASGIGAFNTSSAVSGYALDVRGATNKRFGVSSSNSLSGTSVLFYTDANAFADGYIDASKLILQSQSGGNVGIGTSSPNRILTVYNSNAATLYQTPTSGTSATDGFYVGQTSDVSYLWNYNNFPLVISTNNIERMQITSGGNILMGTTTDNGERLYVSGAIRATGTITANSDITLKKNLLKIENALEKVEQINGYTYEFKEDDSKRHAGVIAQEIQTVLPEIVNKGNDGILGVEYGNISALLIEAIKEQNIKIKNLETLLASK